MSSSSDNKVNMALDDIIKLNKKSATANKKPAGVRGKQGRGGRTVVGGRRFVGGAANRKPAAAGGAVRTRMLQRKVGGAAMNKQATKKLVQSLVKKALKRSTMRRQVAAAPGGLRKRGAVIRDRYVRTNPLNRVLARSRAIRGAVARPTATTVIQQIVPARRVQRGRGFQRNFQRNIVQEIVRRQPVQIVQQQRQSRPVPIRRVVVQRQAQPRVIERITAPVIQRRVVPQFRRVQTVPRRQQQQQVVVVRRQAAPIQRVQPRAIQRNRAQPVVFSQPRRFQRQNNNNFGGGQMNRREFVQKNNRFRSALGLGNGGGRFIHEAQRFEPSSSFIMSHRTVRRGRGFRD